MPGVTTGNQPQNSLLKIALASCLRIQELRWMRCWGHPISWIKNRRPDVKKQRRVRRAFHSRCWDGEWEEGRKRRTGNEVKNMQSMWRNHEDSRLLKTKKAEMRLQTVRAGMHPGQDHVPHPDTDLGCSSLCLCPCYWWPSQNTTVLKMKALGLRLGH